METEKKDYTAPQPLELEEVNFEELEMAEKKVRSYPELKAVMF